MGLTGISSVKGLVRGRFFLIAAVFAGSPLLAQMSVSLTSATSSPQLVGTPIVFTAVVTGAASGILDYQFSTALTGQSPQVVIDYSLQKSFTWTPSAGEGAYTVQVIARNKTTGQSATAQAAFTIQPLITGMIPTVSPTAHPMVGLFSAPACPAGSQMYVVFSGSGVRSQTDQRPCDGQTTMNFYIAGMRPSTAYSMYGVVVTGPVSAAGASVLFTTGTIPGNLQFPLATVVLPPSTMAETEQAVLLAAHSSIDLGALGRYYFPVATDLAGNVIWYYSFAGTPLQTPDYFLRPVDGGTMMTIVADTNSGDVDTRGQLWREIDLAGNTIRQTNATRVSEQLIAAGQLAITDFDHDSIRLPNGHTLILCSQEKIYPAGTQGAAGPLDVVGNAIVDLDENLQLAWSWSAYDHMDVNRAAIVGETCAPFQAGCVPVSLAPVAADWLHGNSLNYIPSNGDVLISFRHQDWVVKIDYANGTGSGAVLWEMGKGGSFTIASADPDPWFSHQHDAEYELNGTTVLSLFDDGNTRYLQNPGVKENSRGMALDVDETALTVTPIVFQDLGFFSPAVGSAQRLNNGNYEFDNGYLNQGPDEYALHQEFTMGGTAVYTMQTNSLAYRDYRMNSLYLLDSLRQIPTRKSCLRGACKGSGGK